MSAHIVTLVDALDRAEQFVLYAARIHRALREQTAPDGLCLCRGFRATGLSGALPYFVAFQNNLAADPDNAFRAADRGSRRVERAELELLQAINRWQVHPHDDPQVALGFIRTPTVRRIAAPHGHHFAVELAAVGLRVRARHAYVRTAVESAPTVMDEHREAFHSVHH